MSYFLINWAKILAEIGGMSLEQRYIFSLRLLSEDCFVNSMSNRDIYKLFYELYPSVPATRVYTLYNLACSVEHSTSYPSAVRKLNEWLFVVSKVK